MATKRENRRIRIKKRIKSKLSGTTQRPRLSIFRSNKFIYAQVIDDTKGATLISAYSGEIESKSFDVATAKEVGKKIAEKALQQGVETVVFDRNGYLYHGKIKALAEGAREGGLKF